MSVVSEAPEMIEVMLVDVEFEPGDSPSPQCGQADPSP